IRAFGDSKKRFSIDGLDAYHQEVVATPFDGSGIECRIDAQPLHEEWVGPLVKIVLPFQRCVCSREYRILEPGKYTVIGPYRFIFSDKQGIVPFSESGLFCFKLGC